MLKRLTLPLSDVDVVEGTLPLKAHLSLSRRAGVQMQIMPTLIRMADMVKRVKNSCVGFDIAMLNLRIQDIRTMPIIVTLQFTIVMMSKV